MKRKLFYISTLLFILCLSGCARNNVNNDVAYRNKNGMEPTTTRVDYNTPNRTPRVTDINDNIDRTTRVPGVTNPNPTPRVPSVNDTNRNQPQYVGDNNNINTGMRVADQAAKKVADLREVDTANIIVANNNAFAAVKLAAGQKLTKNVENKISRSVKSVDRGINSVYISANPDFNKQIQDYSNDIRAGKPVSGLWNQFSQTIRRIFPNVK